MNVQIHDSTRCLLGEGPLWHPERGQFYWCDILSRRILTREGERLRAYDLDRFVSCLGWTDGDHLIAATQTDLILLNLSDGSHRTLCTLEDDDALTRSNDGRADPAGGFWVSTMSVTHEPEKGAIYRFHDGKATRLLGGLSTPNAICFSPDGRYAYFTDTPTHVVQRWRLDAAGWPDGEPEPWIDETEFPHNPDGAVCDAKGRLWISHWGSSRIAVYGADGTFQTQVDLPAKQVTCPAFGGPDLKTLYCTTAAIGLDEITLTTEPHHGCTFRVDGLGPGQPENRVRI